MRCFNGTAKERREEIAGLGESSGMKNVGEEGNNVKVIHFRKKGEKNG